MSGIERIAKERQRQIDVEGFDERHDDYYVGSAMLWAAVIYTQLAVALTEGMPPDEIVVEPPKGWPWRQGWWKPSPDPIRNLEKAGALIAAEIDRLERERARNT